MPEDEWDDGGALVDPAGQVGLLVAAGATILLEDTIHGHLDHVVLADPEGNELCVV